MNTYKVGRFSIKDEVGFSMLKHAEGGMSQSTASFLLSEAKIPHCFSYSEYVGHYAVYVPRRYQKKAERIL